MATSAAIERLTGGRNGRSAIAHLQTRSTISRKQCARCRLSFSCERALTVREAETHDDPCAICAPAACYRRMRPSARNAL
jgi:hypothetical protein